jgi:hypothetical protein
VLTSLLQANLRAIGPDGCSAVLTGSAHTRFDGRGLSRGWHDRVRGAQPASGPGARRHRRSPALCGRSLSVARPSMAIEPLALLIDSARSPQLVRERRQAMCGVVRARDRGLGAADEAAFLMTAYQQRKVVGPRGANFAALLAFRRTGTPVQRGSCTYAFSPRIKLSGKLRLFCVALDRASNDSAAGTIVIRGDQDSHRHIACTRRVNTCQVHVGTLTNNSCSSSNISSVSTNTA